MDEPKVNLTTLSHEVMNDCSSLKFLKERVRKSDLLYKYMCVCS
jgi:hypothetical protein